MATIANMRVLFISISLLFSVGISAQTEVDFLNAIGKGNIGIIDKYLSDSVNLCINDTQEKVDKSLAVKKIDDFFRSKKINKFKILHNGYSADKNSSYRVARINTQSRIYRVFAYAEKENGATQVVEVRIDEM